MDSIRKKVNEYFAKSEPFSVATTTSAVTLAAVGLGYFLLNREGEFLMFFFFLHKTV
jgi:hypothetical protein